MVSEHGHIKARPEGLGRLGRVDALCFCILKALAAWMNISAAFWNLSSRPPKKLKPPPAPCSAFSACADASCQRWLIGSLGS